MDKAFIKNPVEAYEKLKEENKKFKTENDALKNNDVFSIRLFKDKADKYEKALSEIKEIANHCMEQDLCTFCNYNDKCYKGFEDEALSYDVCKLILQKISEVINER